MNDIEGGMEYLIRSITSNDIPFLWDMLFYAAHMSEDGAISAAAAKDDLHLSIYINAWGRPGDFGVLAFDSQGLRPLADGGQIPLWLL